MRASFDTVINVLQTLMHYNMIQVVVFSGQVLNKIASYVTWIFHFFIRALLCLLKTKRVSGVHTFNPGSNGDFIYWYILHVVIAKTKVLPNYDPC